MIFRNCSLVISREVFFVSEGDMIAEEETE